MIDFICTNYKEIIVFVVFVFELVSSIILLIKKSKREPSTFSILLARLPELIKIAEDKYGPGRGDEKKKYVLDSVRSILAIYGLKDDKFLLTSLSEQVESILSTPSKKGKL